MFFVIAFHLGWALPDLRLTIYRMIAVEVFIHENIKNLITSKNQFLELKNQKIAWKQLDSLLSDRLLDRAMEDLDPTEDGMSQLWFRRCKKHIPIQ